MPAFLLEKFQCGEYFLRNGHFSKFRYTIVVNYGDIVRIDNPGMWLGWKFSNFALYN